MRSPYKFKASVAEVRKLVSECNALADVVCREGSRFFTWQPSWPERATKKVYPPVSTKPTKYGVKLECWLMAHKLETWGPDNGCTFDEWQKVTEAFKKRLQATLPGCEPTIDGWSERKPQFRLETYIQYTEHTDEVPRPKTKADQLLASIRNKLTPEELAAVGLTHLLD